MPLILANLVLDCCRDMRVVRGRVYPLLNIRKTVRLWSAPIDQNLGQIAATNRVVVRGNAMDRAPRRRVKGGIPRWGSRNVEQLVELAQGIFLLMQYSMVV